MAHTGALSVPLFQSRVSYKHKNNNTANTINTTTATNTNINTTTTTTTTKVRLPTGGDLAAVARWCGGGTAA
jgi:hypothetical protein